MRLNKYIGETGFCSRREADRLIAERRVTVNGIRRASAPRSARATRSRVDGQALRAAGAKGKRRHVYIALNKPVGVTCTTEATSRATSSISSATSAHLPIGRLDKDSEGLILLTSNGDIVNEILRAENKQEKEYLVGVDNGGDRRIPARHGARRADPRPDDTAVQDRQARQYGFRIVLMQGLNRQIRLMAGTSATG